MNLKNILAGIEGIKAKGDIDIEINSVKNDSRNRDKYFLKNQKPRYLWTILHF